MPISKRDKKVSLTKTSKKGMAMKQKLVEDIRKFLDEHEDLYVFTINNMRNGPLKVLREEWKDSRFFFAKRKVMAIALGRTKEDEMQKNIHKIASHLVGQCGLLFTSRPKDQVLEWFKNFSQKEYAKSGFAATETVVLPKGPLPEFSFALEPHLRSLGLPTQLEKGKIFLREDYTVCSQGSKLTPEQASILKLIGKQMAEFKIKIVCMWSKDGSFEKFKVSKESKQLTGASPLEILEAPVDKLLNEKLENVEKSEPVTVIPEITRKHKKSKVISSAHVNDDGCEMDVVLENTVKSEPVTVFPKVTKENKKSNKKSSAQVNEDNCEMSVKLENAEDSVNPVTASKEETKENKKSIKIRLAPVDESKLVPNNLTGLDNVEKSEPVIASPEITREKPRRSMRTPKPIRRSPEEKTLSVKKLTGSSKKPVSAVKDKVTRTSRATPRKSVSKRIFKESEDVEMAE